MSIPPDIKGYIDQIKNNRNEGASELARQSLQVLKYAITSSKATSLPQFVLDLSEVADGLRSARPVMAPIKNAVTLFQRRIAENKIKDLNSLKSASLVVADNIINTSLESVHRIAEYAKEVLANNDVIMTRALAPR